MNGASWSVPSRRALAMTLVALCGGVLSVIGLSCNSERAPKKAVAEPLVVFAAASLRDAFAALGEEFKQTHPNVELVFNFAGTQELRAQVEQGAAFDVFASADKRHMHELFTEQLTLTPVIFARNEPVVVVSDEARGRVHRFSELPNAQRIALGTAEVPIGRYSLQILDRAAQAGLGSDFRARVESQVVTRELNVRHVLSKVSLGEVEAGIVYRTDVQSLKERAPHVVTIPADMNVIAEYPIAIASKAQHAEVAQEWVAWVLSETGQRALTRCGFLPPAAASAAK